MKRYHYLLSLLFVFCIPSVIAGAFLTNFISLQALVPFVLLITFIGGIWDVWATRHGKKDRTWLWQFNRQQTVGMRFLGLPVEEYLFYIVASVYAVFMWEGMKLALQKGGTSVYLMIAFMGGWTLVSVLVPYFVGWRKGDRFIN